MTLTGRTHMPHIGRWCFGQVSGVYLLADAVMRAGLVCQLLAGRCDRVAWYGRAVRAVRGRA
jgi:hypothetical protein